MTIEAVNFLKQMISIPSYSFEENRRADFISNYLADRGMKPFRINNNIICTSKGFSQNKPVIILNSHIDTVVASKDYVADPFLPYEKDGALYGLGSNDAGASVSALLHTFLHFNDTHPIHNLMLILTAEEEKSGSEGIGSVVKYFNGFADFRKVNAIIGEPTSMKTAIGERGLLVIDGTAIGESAHAAHNNGINSLYIAIDDINFIRNFKFSKKSELMGEVKMTVTQINAGYAHNIIPDKCSFVIDIRPTEQYSNKEIYSLLCENLRSKLSARNLTHKTSTTPLGSILIEVAKRAGFECYISPTTSDWMTFPLPAIKMGPGDSERSHKANEFIKISELNEGIEKYILFLNTLYDNGYYME